MTPLVWLADADRDPGRRRAGRGRRVRHHQPAQRAWDLASAAPHPRHRRDRHLRGHRPRPGHRAGACCESPLALALLAVLAVLSFVLYRGLPRAAAALRPARAALPVHPVGRPGAAERVGDGDGAGRGLRAAAGPQRLGGALPAATPTPGGPPPARASPCCSPAGTSARRTTCSGPRVTPTRWPPRCATAARSPASSWSPTGSTTSAPSTRDDLKLFEALAGHASVALTNSGLVARVRAAAQETEHLSLHDPLTGLPNRLHFQQRLEKRLLADGSAAVLLMDVDRFKEVNDTLGHDVGDRLLREVGRRLRQVERGETVVARLGGDEFAVLLGGDDVHIEGMVARITRDMSRPVRPRRGHPRRDGVASASRPPRGTARRPRCCCAGPRSRCTTRSTGSPGWPATPPTATPTARAGCR